MNQEEKKQMELLEQAIDLFQQEVEAKDALIQEQLKVIQAQEQHIDKLTGLLNKIFEE
ncbi:hypothetical protein [Blautia sp.]|uniref:hypothetical protein n=1 Tax=Blautia sp. TaxID=1955243 RepID=UPI0025C57916|nr:hypothetical protein [Blautia sp.]